MSWFTEASGTWQNTSARIFPYGIWNSLVHNWDDQMLLWNARSQEPLTPNPQNYKEADPKPWQESQDSDFYEQ